MRNQALLYLCMHAIVVVAVRGVCLDGEYSPDGASCVPCSTGPCPGATEYEMVGCSASADRVCQDWEASVNCEVGEWGAWSVCSQQCGTGERHRVRNVVINAENGGNSCPSLMETEDCNTQICCQDGAELENGVCVVKDACLTEPCGQFGTCSVDFSCNCETGFTGDSCDINIDDCDPNPCGEGSCTDGIASFECDCTDTGFSGPLCDCEQGNCIGAVSCPTTDTKVCSTCDDGFTGMDCESFCEVGNCIPEFPITCDQDGQNRVCTACAGGFWGDDCTNMCLADLCPDGPVSCSKSDGSSTVCSACPVGFYSRDCSLPCETGFCDSPVTCDIDTGGSRSCDTCIVGYKHSEGSMDCAEKINPCDDAPCLNGGTCEPGAVLDFNCTCPSTTSGALCDVILSSCTSTTCSNFGTCDNTAEGPVCRCQIGWEGETCAESSCPIDLCDVAENKLCLSSIDVKSPSAPNPDCGTFRGCENGNCCFDGCVDARTTVLRSVVGGSVAQTTYGDVVSIEGQAPSGSFYFESDTPVDSMAGDKASFTISFTVRSLASQLSILLRSDDVLNWFTFTSTQVGLVMRSNATSTEHLESYFIPTDILDGEWHLLTITGDKSQTNLVFRIDAENVATALQYYSLPPFSESLSSLSLAATHAPGEVTQYSTPELYREISLQTHVNGFELINLGIASDPTKLQGSFTAYNFDGTSATVLPGPGQPLPFSNYGLSLKVTVDVTLSAGSLQYIVSKSNMASSTPYYGIAVQGLGNGLFVFSLLYDVNGKLQAEVFPSTFVAGTLYDMALNLSGQSLQWIVGTSTHDALLATEVTDATGAFQLSGLSNMFYFKGQLSDVKLSID